jgi:hypothetical protein
LTNTRHTFGSLAINDASIVPVQVWMGHADVKTTMRYLHHKSRVGDARCAPTPCALTAMPPTGALARQREGALDAAVFSRDLLLAKVHAQRC